MKFTVPLQRELVNLTWRKVKVVLSAVFLWFAALSKVAAAQPEIATLTFNSTSLQMPLGTNAQPAWLQAVVQQGGEFIDEPPCWHVAANQPAGRGRLELTVDRSLLAADLALGILCEDSTNTDLAVQLFDDENRVIAVDLFYNLIAVGREAQTDTFIVPLRKYPTAKKILIRRVEGDVKVMGVVLYPVVGELPENTQSQHDLVRLFGDPLSPDNPLLKPVQHVVTHPNSTAVTHAPGAVQWRMGEAAASGNSVVVVDQATAGFYNAALGTVLDGSQPQFPRPLLKIGVTAENDPVFYPSAEPSLAAASAILGNWLAAGSSLLNTNWQHRPQIPSTWTVNSEVAIVYEVDGGSKGIAKLRGNFDVDNGIYVWVNGQYKFGARSPGLPSPAGKFEYANIDLGNLKAGRNYIQVLCEDSGIATGYSVKITGIPIR